MLFRSTIVDITVHTLDIQIRDWAFLSSMAKITDHIPITFKIPKSMTKVIKSRSLAKCDWIHFRHELSKQGELQRYDLWSVDRLNAAVTFLENKIISALDIVAPLKESKIKVRTVKPWSPELSSAYKAYTRSKKLHKDGDLVTYAAMKDARREFRRLHKLHQKASFQEFTEELQENNHVSKFVKNKLDPKPPIGMLDVADGGITTNGQEVLDILFDKHFPGSTKIKPATPANKMLAFDRKKQAKIGRAHV